MTSSPASRADRAAIRRSILDILEATAASYKKHGDPKSDLRDAPEYLITVSLAQGLAQTFPMLRYRLEHHASAFDRATQLGIDSRAAVGKDSARFDIVMLNESNNVPRCILEVKLGVKIVDDAKRIIAMAALESGRPRWRHGYLVTVLRRTESEATRLVNELAEEIQGLRTSVSAALPEHQEVKVVHALRKIGASRSGSDDEFIYGVVFHVALIDRLVSESESTDTVEAGG